nr:RecName: Full=17 kDa cell wall protein [Arabidopsis thaliana]
ADREPNHFVA